MSWIRLLETVIREGAEVAGGVVRPPDDALRRRFIEAADSLANLNLPEEALSASVPGLPTPADIRERLDQAVEDLRAWGDQQWTAARAAAGFWLIDRVPRIAGWMILERVIVVDGDGVPQLDHDRLLEWMDDDRPFLSTEMWEAAVGDLGADENAQKIVAVLGALVLVPRTLGALLGGSTGVAPLRGPAEKTRDAALRAAFEAQRDWVSGTFLPHAEGGAVPADGYDYLPGLPPGQRITVAVRGTVSDPSDPADDRHTNGELWVGARVEADEFVYRFDDAAPEEIPEDAPFSRGWALRIAPMATFGVGRVDGEWHGAFRTLPNRDGSTPSMLAQGDTVEVTLGRETAGADFAVGVPFDSQTILEDLTVYARVRDTAPVLEAGVRADRLSIYLSPRAFRDGIGARLGGPQRFREGMTFEYELLELAWLAGVGTRLNIQGRAETYIVIEKSLGPLTIHGLEIALPTRVETEEVPGASDIEIREIAAHARFHLSVDLGPLLLVVSGLGFWGGYRKEGDEDAEFFGLHTPNGAGLEVTLSGVRGGGFLERKRKTDRIEWGGVLDVQVGPIGFGGVALYEQWIGDAEDRPVSFLGVLTMRFPVPLFAGVLLDGGSLLFGMHRRIDSDAMRRRLTGGALDSLFFPSDPVKQAPVILRDLRAFFPTQQDSHVAGLGLKISVVNIMSLKLGAALEIEVGIPGGARVSEVVFAGVVSVPDVPKSVLVQVPDAEDMLRRVRKIYQINAHAIGVLDPKAGRFSLDATLVNSKMVGVLSLTGDAAIRVSTREDPHTEVSIGGFHPEFDGYRGLYPKMKRLGANIDTKLPITLRVEGYLAFTDSAVMLGGKISASGKIGGFKVAGWIFADLLIEDRNAFTFSARIGGGVSVSWKRFKLAGVTLKGEMKGVDPVVLTLRATFEIGWWDKSFDKTYNLSRIAREGLDERRISVPEEVIVTFSRQALSAAGESVDPDVVAAGRPEDDGVLVFYPGAALTWSQNAVPLGTSITRFRGRPVTGGRQKLRASVEGMGVGTPPRLTFAHDSYLDLTRAQRLQAGGFTEHPSGVRFGADGVRADGPVRPFEETAIEVIDVGPRSTRPDPGPVGTRPSQPPQHARRAALARRGPAADRAPDRPRYALAKRRYETPGGALTGVAEAVLLAPRGAVPMAEDAPVMDATLPGGP